MNATHKNPLAASHARRLLAVAGRTLCLLGAAACSHAATITQTQPYGTQPTPFTETLSFNRFDPALGTLNSAVWSLSLNNSGGDITLDNDAATAATVQYDIGSIVSLRAPAVGVTPQLPGISTGASFVRTINLAADDGDGTTLDASGPDGAFRTRGFPQSSSINNQPAFHVASYVGTVPFNVEADVRNVPPISFISGASRSDIQTEVSPIDTSGVFTLVYNYTPVPEPAAGALLALGLAGVVGARQRGD